MVKNDNPKQDSTKQLRELASKIRDRGGKVSDTFCIIKGGNNEILITKAENSHPVARNMDEEFFN